MNKIIDKCLFTGNKFMPALHSKQPRFTYSARGPFTKHCQRIQTLKTCNLKHLYRNELDKACFAHNAAYSDNKILAKIAISDKILKDKACEITRNCKHDGYQSAFASMVYKIFYEKTKSGISVNEQLAEEIHEPVIKRFRRRKLYAKFKEIFGQQI